jgi:pantoate--beta-alanine ligase
MQSVGTTLECRELLDQARATGRTVGLVPTMGALHAGHLSLITRARAECDVVVVSIFVNPLQFGDPEDIAHYPRTLDADLAACAEAGVDVVFAPSVSEMYPNWPAPIATSVTVSGVSAKWEGASRPGHFDGVVTVVTKLFAIAGPARAYFGEKDFQQLAVVRQLVTDLSLSMTVIGCETVREGDGLALSSRNVRLVGDERRAAVVLSRALRAGADAIEAGTRSALEVGAIMRGVVATEPLVHLDYAVVVRADDLIEQRDVTDPTTARLLIAAEVGSVRLIDNGPALTVSQPTPPTAPQHHRDDARNARLLERIG